MACSRFVIEILTALNRIVGAQFKSRDRLEAVNLDFRYQFAVPCRSACPPTECARGCAVNRLRAGVLFEERGPIPRITQRHRMDGAYLSRRDPRSCPVGSGGFCNRAVGVKLLSGSMSATGLWLLSVVSVGAATFSGQMGRANQAARRALLQAQPPERFHPTHASPWGHRSPGLP